MDISPSSIGAVSVRGPHSRISDSELYNRAVSCRAHVVEPESLLPRTEQGAPQWMSLKAGAQGTSGLTRDNIYPQTIMSSLDCVVETILEVLHFFPPASIVLVIMSPGLFNNQLCNITV